MIKTLQRLGLATIVVLLSMTAANATTPIQFTFFDFNAPESDEISGFRFPAIYGKDGGDISGIEIQLFAYSEMNSLTGVTFPAFPFIGANRISNEMNGVAFGFLNWHEGQDTGANFGVVNFTNNVKGLNWSVLNFSTGHTLADVGVVNVSQKSNFQLSLVNVTQELDGLQLGLINCANNGFLPCFVFFNFGSSN